LIKPLGLVTMWMTKLRCVAFKQLQLRGIIPTTEYSNVASQAVMQKVGMTIARNPLPKPPWLQIVGILENN
jgi:ribosomal-protein-alanine N-acetyltransferase